MQTAEPKTDEQWRDVVDAAAALLQLDAAQKFGLVTISRCRDLLQRGADLGYLPSKNVVERLVSSASGSRALLQEMDEKQAGNGKLVQGQQAHSKEQALATWRQMLKPKEFQMLKLLVDSPAGLSQDELRKRLGVSAGSGTFGTYLKTLKTHNLITGDPQCWKAEPLFFS